MAKLKTRQFGTIQCNDNAAVTFPLGLLGFESSKRFALVEHADAAPLVFLQSLDSEELYFITAPVQAIDKNYELALLDDDIRQLGLDPNRTPSAEDVVCLAILSAPVKGPATANLSIQSVRIDGRYSHQHPISDANTIAMNKATQSKEAISKEMPGKLPMGASTVKVA
jgi:flagellar assembly factor FliW